MVKRIPPLLPSAAFPRAIMAAIVNGMSQFVFRIDVFRAIWAYRNTRNTKEAFLS